MGENYEGTDRPGKGKLQKWLEQLSFLEKFQDDEDVACVRVRPQAMSQGKGEAAPAPCGTPPATRSRVTGDDHSRPRGWESRATACVPGESHKPAGQRRGDPRYWMFKAASDGCLPCVRHFLEHEKVHPDSRSQSQGYTVLDWAVWAREQGRPGAEAVE